MRPRTARHATPFKVASSAAGPVRKVRGRRHCPMNLGAVSFGRENLAAVGFGVNSRPYEPQTGHTHTAASLKVVAAARATRRRRAFTLIELLVVILIIAILIAVAAPSFLGQQAKAQDSSAKQGLTVLYKAAKADSVDNDPQGAWKSGGDLDAKVFDKSEPQMKDITSALATATDDSREGRVRHLLDSDADTLKLVAHSDSGHAYLLTAAKNHEQTVERGTCAGPDENAVYADGGADELTYAQEVLADHPSLYWMLDDAPGSTTLADASPHGATGSVTGDAPTFGGGPLVGQGTSLTFEGSFGASLGRANAGQFTNAITVEYWLNYIPGGDGYIITGAGVYDEDGTYNPGDYMDSAPHNIGPGTDNFSGASCNASSREPGQLYDPPLISGVALTAGVHQIACTWDGSMLRLYIDGAEAGSAQFTKSLGETAKHF